RAVEAPLGELASLQKISEALAAEARADLAGQGVSASRVVKRVHLKYEGTDTALPVALGSAAEMTGEFEAAYRKQFSFLMPGRKLVAEALSVEAIAGGEDIPEKPVSEKARAAPAERVRMFTGGRWHEAPLYRREHLAPGQSIEGPAIIAEANATTV